MVEDDHEPSFKVTYGPVQQLREQLRCRNWAEIRRTVSTKTGATRYSKPAESGSSFGFSVMEYYRPT